MVAVFALRKPTPRPAASRYNQSSARLKPAARGTRAEFSQRGNSHHQGASVHRNFKVASATTAHSTHRMKNRITTCDSCQPFFSK